MSTDTARPPTMPPAVRQFITDAVVCGDMALPFHYGAPDDWQRLQVGFRVHGITGQDLTGNVPGAWQPGWHVIALNGFDDPFFIDLGEASAGFPVYFAPIGVGRWNAVPAAPDLERFSAMLQTLAALGDDDAAALAFIEPFATADNTLWSEVRCNRLEARSTREEVESIPASMPPTDPDLWQRGTLLLTHVGPNRLKVMHVLKQALHLTPTEALALIGRLPVTLGCDYRIRLRGLCESLTALGATLEFARDGDSDTPPE
ncbi:hypothetical protein [Diaphorobacter caeni]|uniref:hypothetical protein n=1 Tax=Diaphorobacter caeni TaxID=2784387 RepID=UPI00188EC781|nr:hypothetical protein [Diaphorobacter caeni]MBF5005240.1 hypothetical protein [Diaphorobacter caeni]